MSEEFKNLEIQDNYKAIFHLTSEEAWNTFKLGLEKHPQNWTRHPETQEFQKFLNTNREYPEIYVKYKDFTKRIK
jgi:hypothetical protein